MLLKADAPVETAEGMERTELKETTENPKEEARMTRL